MLCKPRCECLVSTNRKTELSVQRFWVTSVSAKSHLVCFMIFWEMKPEKHLSVFQLMRTWQLKQLTQYSGKNSSKIRMNGTSLTNKKKKKEQIFQAALLRPVFFITQFVLCHINYLLSQNFELFFSPGRRQRSCNINRKAGVLIPMQGLS